MLDPKGKERLRETYKLVILQVGYNFLRVGLSPLLEVSDTVLVKLLLNGFHVSLSLTGSPDARTRIDGL